MHIKVNNFRKKENKIIKIINPKETKLISNIRHIIIIKKQNNGNIKINKIHRINLTDRTSMNFKKHLILI